MTEDRLQYEFFKWADKALPKVRRLLWHCPNGGNRSDREGAKFATIGVKPGVADVHLDVPNEEYHGLKIEFKKPRAKPTHKIKKIEPAQVYYKEAVERAGYKYAVCDDLETAKGILLDYLRRTGWD